MKPRTTISIEALEQLREEIAKAPPVTRERFTKLEAVRRLRPDLQAMRERGYSLQAIAKFLSDRGVSLAPTVLSSYLSEAKSGHESRPKRSKGPMRGPVRTSSGPTVDTPAGGAPAVPLAASGATQATMRSAGDGSTGSSSSAPRTTRTQPAKPVEGTNAGASSATPPAAGPPRRKSDFELTEDSKKL